MAQSQQQIMMQNHNEQCASNPNYINQNINYYEECKNGTNCKSFKYGTCVYYHKSNNNNKQDVKEIINAINTNFEKIIQLNSGNILLYEKQLNISNTNMKEINKKLNVVNNLEDMINNSFGKFQKLILNTMNNKIEKLSKYLIINQTNTQNELKELRKDNDNIFITINNTEKKLDKKLSEIYKNINNKHIKIKNNNQFNIQEQLNDMKKEINKKLTELTLQTNNTQISSKIDKKLNDMIKKLSEKSIKNKNESSNKNYKTNININDINKLLSKYNNSNQLKVIKKIDGAVIQLKSDIKEECEKLDENNQLKYKKCIKHLKNMELKDDKTSNKLNLICDYNILDNDYNVPKCISPRKKLIKYDLICEHNTSHYDYDKYYNLIKKKSEIITKSSKIKIEKRKNMFKYYILNAVMTGKFLKSGKRCDDKALLELDKYLMNKSDDKNIEINRIKINYSWKERLEIITDKKLDIDTLKKEKRQLDCCRIYWADEKTKDKIIKRYKSTQPKQEPPSNLCRFYPGCNKKYSKNQCHFYHPTEEEMYLWHMKYNMYPNIN